MKIFIAALFSLITYCASAQTRDTVILMNGKQKIVQVSHETPSYIVYQKIKRSGKLSGLKDMMVEDVFQIRYFHHPDSAQQKVSQLYEVDSLLEDYFTPNEMEQFLAGRNEARHNYKAFKFTAGGFLVGVGSGYLGAFWGLVPCGLYTGASAYMNFPAFFKVSNENLLKNDHFLAGYKEQARKKQARNAALGSITGLITSVTSLYFFFQANE